MKSKRILVCSIIAFLVGFTCSEYASWYTHQSWEVKQEAIFVPSDSLQYRWELMYIAIAIEETKMDNDAVNPYTKAAGIIQILPLERNGYLREANAIVGYDKYTNECRYNFGTAREIFELVQTKYNPEQDIEKAVRIHLFGYSGYKANPNRKSRYVRNVLNYIDIIDCSTKLRLDH